MTASLSHPVAAPGARAHLIDRRELLLWATLILQSLHFTFHLSLGLSQRALGSQDGLGAFDVLGALVALWRIRKAQPAPANLAETVGVVGLCLAAAIGPHLLAPFALTWVGIYALVSRDPQLKAAGAVLVALSVHELWSKVVFAAVAPEFVRLDASLVGNLVHLTVPGAVFRDNIITTGGGHAIAIAEGCSSFVNISVALLGWVSLTKLERPNWVRGDAAVLLAVIGMQIALNVGRMYLMALSRDLYFFWHDGAGSQIYVATASAAAVLVSSLGARWAGRRARDQL